jgi:hypothetical protein
MASQSNIDTLVEGSKIGTAQIASKESLSEKDQVEVVEWMKRIAQGDVKEEALKVWCLIK